MLKKTLVAAILLLLFACSDNAGYQFQGSDISAANLDGSFELMNHHGKSSNLSDFKGKVVAIFFGFTNCPDVCPTSLQELKFVRSELGEVADDFQVIFVTLDPDRDTIEKLKLYIPSIDESFLGLRGSSEQTRMITSQYKVFYEKVGEGDDYTIDHSSGIYLIDKTGRIRARHPYGLSNVDNILSDVRHLILS